MSDARVEIVLKIADNPEKAADAFIELQKEFIEQKKRTDKLEKVATAADEVINFQGPDIKREVEKREALKKALGDVADGCA